VRRTVGTGIGGGVVLDGAIYRSPTGLDAELFVTYRPAIGYFSSA